MKRPKSLNYDYADDYRKALEAYADAVEKDNLRLEKESYKSDQALIKAVREIAELKQFKKDVINSTNFVDRERPVKKLK